MRVASTVLKTLAILLLIPSLTAARALPKGADEVEVRFLRALAPEELAAAVNDFGVRPLEIYYEKDTMTAGYTLSEGEPIESALLAMEEKHRDFLEAALEAVTEAREATTDRVAARGYSRLQREFTTAMQELNAGHLTIHAMKVEGTNEATPLLQSGLVESIRPAPGRVLSQQEKGLQSSSSKSYSHETWAPYYGSSKVTRSLTFQTFYFNSLSGFTAYTAYEHETQVYDTRFADYDNYWASNMPGRYKDTQAGDNNGIDNFAVGSTAPTSFQKHYMYYTHMALRSGGSTTVTPTVRIKGQLGNKSLNCNGWAWCVYSARATTGSLTTFTAPIYSTRTWSY